MRVAYFLYTSGWGGVEIYLSELIKSLSKQARLSDFKIFLYLYTPPEEIRTRVSSAFKALNVDVRELDHYGAPVGHELQNFSSRIAEMSRSAASEESHPSERQKQSLKEAFARFIPGDVKSALQQWKRVRQGASELKEAGIDVAHFLHGAYPSLKIAVLSAWLAGIKIRIADIHGEPKREPWKGLTQWGINYLALRGVTHNKVLSQCMKEQLMDRCGIRSNTKVIGNGIDPDAFRQLVRPLEVRKRFGLASKHSVGCVVGRLFEKKGCEDAIKAFVLRPSLSSTHLLFVGEGPLEKSLKDQVLASRLENNVHFFGFSNDVASILSEADFLVMPSHSEGAPLVVLEAMVLGKPIISTRVGALAEMLGSDYPKQFVVEPGKPAELGRAIEELSLMPPAARAALGKGLSDRVRLNYSRDVIHQKIFNLYKDNRN